MQKVIAIQLETELSWRGSLLPLGSEAAPYLGIALCLINIVRRFYDCCAAEREQAPSPQVSSGRGSTSAGMQKVIAIQLETELSWRGSLLPLGSEAAPCLGIALCLINIVRRFYDCCAAEREQAPSPQVSSGRGSTSAGMQKVIAIQLETELSWRGSLLPLGSEAAPCLWHRGLSDQYRSPVLRLLRSRTGASSLATRFKASRHPTAGNRQFFPLILPVEDWQQYNEQKAEALRHRGLPDRDSRSARKHLHCLTLG
ncbi:hypothetical protein ABH909_001843 [Pseudomonas sp. BS3782 TE3695]